MYLDVKKKLVKSRFMQIAKGDDNLVIWHSLFGSPKIISFETLELINLFSQPISIESVCEDYDLDGDIIELFTELVSSYFLISQDIDERKIINECNVINEQKIIGGGLVDYLELIVAENCNFACDYCIHFTNLSNSDRLSKKKIMGFETAKEAIDKYISLLRLHGKKDGAINFGGGEPLLNWKVIEMSLRYIKATYSDEFELRLTLNTNASLLTAEIAENLKRYGVEIASSLDGLAKANNLVRLTSSGEETFDLIVNGFRNLELVGYPIEGISITINERNFQYILTEIIDWAVERKMTDLRIDIDVVGAINIPVAEVADKLMLLWKYAKQRKIQIAGFWSRPYENLSLSVLTDDVGFCGGVKGNSICVSPSREIFMCGYSNTILGNLDSFGQSLLVDGTYYNLVKNRQTGQMKMCQDCPIECQCNGGCQITQEYAAEINSMKLDRMCELYKTMTYRLLLEQISTQL